MARDEELKKRKSQRKQAVREDRHKSNQDLRIKRAEALDRFAAENQKNIRPQTPAGVQEMADRGNAQIRPPEQAIGVMPPVTEDQKYAIQPPQIMPPQPVGATALQPAQVMPGQDQATPDAVWEPQPPPPQVLPPQQVAPQPGAPGAGIGMLPPDQVDVDPTTGEVAPMAAPSVYTAPATPEEAQAQASLDQAQAQGTQFAFTRPPMTDASQFQAGLAKGGTSAARNPRDMERMRRKRLALLTPRIQQLRPWGRGLPQIRYQGGPAFEGAIQPQQSQIPSRVGGGRPQYRQPLAR